MNTPAAKYHGLFNHGETCYLNSVLQVLFMTKDFREAIQRQTSDDLKRIDWHLKDLFDRLLQQTTYTYEIMKSLQIDRVYEQRDAAEYLERILRQTSPNAADIFHGRLINTTTCSRCETKTDSEEPFWYLPLPLVDSCSGVYSVVEGLEEFFKTSNLSGENQMYCDRCDAKVDAQRTKDVKHHPDVLIVLLKRFDFSYQHMSFVKINSEVDVPCTLKIPENQKYELYAVVDHFGDLTSGHYAAAIKVQDDENKWHYFDDTSVMQINQPFLNNKSSEKSQSAYLLFYRRKDVGVEETVLPTNGGSPTSTCENYNQSHDAETVRRPEEHGHAEEVSVDTVTGSLHHITVLTDEISVSSEKEMLSDHNLNAHHSEVKAEVESELSDCSSDSHVREQESDEGRIMREEQKGHDDKVQAEHSSLLSHKVQPEVQDPENLQLVEFEEIKLGAKQDFTSVSEGSVAEAVPHKQEEMSNTQRTEPGEETDEHEKPEKPLNMDAGQHHDKESSHVGQNLQEYPCGSQTDGVDDGFKPSDVNKEGEEEKMETDIKDETEGGTDNDQARSPKRLLTKYDLVTWM